MPYPIPDKPWSPDLAYFLIAVPADRGFIQAVKGAFTELGSARLWGLEGVEDDSQDAADRWNEAVTETWRLIEMGWPDLVLDYIDEVETLLRALQTLQSAGSPCCADNLGPVDGEETTTYDETNVPTTWGDSETVADLDDFEQLKCGAAHAYVDHLKGMADQMDDIVAAGAIAVGAIAAILGLLSGAGIILAIAYGTAAGVVSGLIAGATEATFAGTAAAIESARAELVCELVQQDVTGFETVLSGAIGAAWTLFFQYVDYDSAVAVIANGGAGSEYLTVNRRTDCDCTVVYDIDHTFTFDTDKEGWSLGNRSGWNATYQALGLNPDLTQGDAWVYLVDDVLHAAEGNPVPTPFYVDEVVIEVRTGTSFAPKTLEVEVVHEDATSEIVSVPSQSDGAVVTQTMAFTSTKEASRLPSGFLFVRGKDLTGSGSGVEDQCWLQSVTVRGTII